MKPYQKEIEEYDSMIQKASQLESDAHTLRRTAKQLVANALCDKYGLESEKTVLTSNGKRFVFHSVYGAAGSFELAHDQKPWVTARQIKKDGSPGELVRTLYRGWEKEAA